MQFPPLPLQIYPSRWKSLLFVILSVALCAGAYYMTQADEDTRRMSAETAQFIGWAGLLLFGGLFPIHLYQLIFRPPQIVITSKGVYQVSILSALSEKMTVFMPWNDIAGISTQKIKSTTYLYMHRKDGSKAITIQPFALSIKAQDFTDMIAYYQNAYMRPAGAAPGRF